MNECHPAGTQSSASTKNKIAPLVTVSLLLVEAEQLRIDGVHRALRIQLPLQGGVPLQQLQQGALIRFGIQGRLLQDGLLPGFPLLAVFLRGIEQGRGVAYCRPRSARRRVSDADGRQVAQPVAAAGFGELQQPDAGLPGVEGVD